MEASRERESSIDHEELAVGEPRWWESIVRILLTYRMAISVPLVLLATLGVLLMPLGWWLSGLMFLNSNVDSEPRTVALGSPEVETDWRIFSSWRRTAHGDARWHVLRQLRGGERVVVPPVVAASDEGIAETPDRLPRVPIRAGWAQAPADPVFAVPYHLAAPAFRLFKRDLTWGQLAFYLFGAIWTLLVWTLLGGAICRIAAVRIGRDERVGLRESLFFAQRRWLGLVGGPCLPLIGIALIAFPVVILGLIARFNVGLMLAALLFPFVLLCGLLMAILALGLVFGWPLMWATIGAEGSDSFDAISRSYAYTFQCAARYFVYALLAAIIGLLGWLITWFVAQTIVSLSFWGLEWGMGPVRSERLYEWRFGLVEETPSRVVTAAVWLIHFFISAVWLVAASVAYSHFWCMATAVYLLLRRDADETELEDIFLEEEDDSSYGLPPEGSIERPHDFGTGGDSLSPAESSPTESQVPSAEPSGEFGGQQPSAEREVPVRDEGQADAI